MGDGISLTYLCRAQEDETILHVLCDCVHAAQLWLILVTQMWLIPVLSNSITCLFYLAYYFHDDMLVLVNMA